MYITTKIAEVDYTNWNYYFSNGNHVLPWVLLVDGFDFRAIFHKGRNVLFY